MSANQNAPYYFVPEPSKWPLFGSIAAVFLTFGASGTVNQQATGPWLLLVGFLMLFYTLYGWFANVAAESESGTYNELVGVSFRWSMSWFIFSEVMFFAAFFGALFYAR
ncbi:MAG: cytochrome c oxidase subunit 3, partial [Betaproteobacteria bacterium]|nr:cytochrome c oxidase subunit 3 [Betaproteobacteria bacterium]